MIYYGLFFIIIIFAFIDLLKTKNKNIKNIIFIFSFFLLLVFAFIRDKIGTDFLAYKIFYTTLDLNIPFEKGYVYLNILLNSINKDFSFFLFGFTIFSLGLKYIYIFKNVYYKNISILYYFSNYYFVFEFGILRNSLAVTITLFSIKYVIERKLLKFLLLILIAATFHRTAIVFIIVYFIVNRNYKNRYLVTGVITAFILGRYSKFIFDVMLRFALFIGEGNIYDKLSVYMTLENKLPLISIGNFTTIIMLVIFLGMRSKVKEKFKNYDIYLNLVILGYIMSYLFYSIPDIAIRIPVYFDIYKIVLLPAIFIGIKTKRLKIIFLLFLILLGFFKLFLYFGMWKEYFIPYRHILY